MIKDYNEDDEIYKPKYDSILTDVIIMKWTELEDPFEWIESDQKLFTTFEKSFNANKKLTDIKLYRGTDYIEYLDLLKGDKINFDRYSSWTTDPTICHKFTDPDSPPIYFVYDGVLDTFDLKTRDEKEHIVSPSNFIVKDVINISRSSDESYDLINGLSGKSRSGDGKIFILNQILLYL